MASEREVYLVQIAYFREDGNLYNYKALQVASAKIRATDQGWAEVRKAWPDARYHSACSQLASECELKPFERVKVKNLQDGIRHAEIEEEIKRRGVYLLPVSSRRYLVIKCDASSGIASFGHKYHYNAYASVLFGPASLQQCAAWIADNTPEVLEEHKPT
jgi:hypothetical protein